MVFDLKQSLRTLGRVTWNQENEKLKMQTYHISLAKLMVADDVTSKDKT